MATPCSVKAYGFDLRIPPQLEVTNCDFKFSNSLSLIRCIVYLTTVKCLYRNHPGFPLLQLLLFFGLYFQTRFYLF